MLRSSLAGLFELHRFFSDLKIKLTIEGNNNLIIMSSVPADYKSSMKYIRATSVWIKLENR
ncbi:hypothetical protein BgiMline_006506, partial [Biomphalaria glabrata]